jgi:hypothetical protein
VAKLVARLLATTALWVRLPSPDISQKPQMGDTTYSSPPKNIQKLPMNDENINVRLV